MKQGPQLRNLFCVVAYRQGKDQQPRVQLKNMSNINYHC